MSTERSNQQHSSSGRFFLLLTVAIPLLLGIAIVAHWFWTSRAEYSRMLPSIAHVPEFSLVTDREFNFTRANLSGKVSIVDFIFTECAGTCLMMSTKMRELQQRLRDDPAVQFVSVSVDPETDDPAVLREYAERFGADSTRWTFLTGDKQAIYSLTQEGFLLGLDIEGEEAIIHSQKFVLVDHTGTIRGYYDSEDDAAMQSLARDTRLLAGRIRP